MTPEARRSALSQIAVEYVLSRRELLDSISRPVVLRVAPAPRTEILVAAVEGVLSRLPDDLASRFSDPVVGENGMVSVHVDTADAFLAAHELLDDAGKTWFAALSGAVFVDPLDVDVIPERLVDTALELVVNNLNRHDTGGYWGIVERDDEQCMLRVCAAVTASDADTAAWSELVAYLVTASLATTERWEDEPTPAKTYFGLLTRPDDVRPFSQEEVLHAVERFRDSLPPDLARVVEVRQVDDLVSLIIPFPAEGEMHHLVPAFRPHPDFIESLGVEVPGLKIYANTYADLSHEEAYEWARILNGDDDTPGLDDVWEHTTPWTLGSWQAHRSDEQTAHVFYRGFVPASLARFTTLDAVVRGVVGETWNASNRYRLRREFDATVEGVDVDA